MATQNWTTRVRHDSDATFQEWASELYAKLVAAGLVATADTGQLAAPVVAARPGTSTSAGYWIFKLNDALFATAPVYFRIEVGTGLATTTPRINIGVGTATNGAGTLSGTAASTGQVVVHAGSGQTVDTGRNSLLCVNEGFFGFNWKIGSGNNEAMFLFNRTCDSSGTPTVQGAYGVWGQQASTITQSQSYRYAATAAAYTAKTTLLTGASCFAPQLPASAAIGSNIQVYMCWFIAPEVVPCFGIAGAIDTDVPVSTTFSTIMVGATPRTYIGLSAINGAGPGLVSAGHPKFCMLWE